MSILMSGLDSNGRVSVLRLTVQAGPATIMPNRPDFETGLYGCELQPMSLPGFLPLRQSGGHPIAAAD